MFFTSDYVPLADQPSVKIYGHETYNTTFGPKVLTHYQIGSDAPADLATTSEGYIDDHSGVGFSWTETSANGTIHFTLVATNMPWIYDLDKPQ